LGDSGDGGDSSFGIPPADCRNCHPYSLHDGHVDDDGILGIPLRKSRHRHAAILLSEAARRRIAGRSLALRESRGNVWHTALCRAKCSVLHPVNAVEKIGRIFLTAGVVLHARKGRVNPTPAFCVCRVFSRRDDSGGVS